MNQKARRALAWEFKAEATGSIIIGFCDKLKFPLLEYDIQ